MAGQNYSTDILISTKSEAVYKAITKDIDKWWTESSNQTPKVGDKLVVRFEKTTYWAMEVSEAIQNRSLVWKVTEGNHDFDGITKKDEWKETTIKWNIEECETGSNVTLTHQGLVPALVCYEICHAGWDYFLGSLKTYLETGKGYPFKEEAAK